MVSVIITTYGGSLKLKRAINSILCQTYTNIEIIVVDDNNPETEARSITEKIMSSFSNSEKVIYVQHERNKNGAVARNTGISLARGKYIAFLDDDDFYLSTRIEKAVNLLELNNSIGKDLVGVCYGVACIDEGYITKIIQNQNGEELAIKLLLTNQNAIGTGSNIFVTKEAVEKVKGFDTDFLRFQDIEFMIRQIETQRIIYQNEVLIVKDISDTRIPKYKNVKEAFELFNQKFESLINSMDQNVIEIYYKDKYSYLFLLAEIGSDINEIIEAGNLLNNNYERSPVEMFFIRHPALTSFLWKFRKTIKKKYLKKMYAQIKQIKICKLDKKNISIIGRVTYNQIHDMLDIK